MNSEEDSSFEVLETSDYMATPSSSMETKEPIENKAHSDNMVKNLKDQVDQFGAQEKPVDSPQTPDVPENPEENEDQRIEKVFQVFNFFHFFFLFLKV